MTTEQKNALIYRDPIGAYNAFIVNAELDKTHKMLRQTAVNALCIESGTHKSKFELLASQQALYMMLNLEMI